MPADRQIIAAMLASMGADAAHLLEQNLSHLDMISGFAHGRDASVSEYQDALRGNFRKHATEMAKKTRNYAGSDAGAMTDLLDNELQRLIEAMVDRSKKARETVVSIIITQAFAAELVRIKNDALRDFQHLPLEVPSGLSVHVTGNQGPVNVAAGTGNTANQAVKGTSGQELMGILAQIRDELPRDVDPEKIIDVTDEIEHLQHEASKPAPDKKRILRFAKRLGETAEKTGVAIAPKLIDALLKSAQ